MTAAFTISMKAGKKYGIYFGKVLILFSKNMASFRENYGIYFKGIYNTLINRYIQKTLFCLYKTEIKYNISEYIEGE